MCPTGALLGPHRIDASRCISYLTIEHKGSIPVELRERMGAWVFGCDLCQEVCPLNVKAMQATHRDLTTDYAGAELDLEELLTMPDDDAFVRRFAGSPVMRPGRIAMVRNACIAAANTGARHLIPVLRELSENPTTDADAEMIREHAAWALKKLSQA